MGGTGRCQEAVKCYSKICKMLSPNLRLWVLLLTPGTSELPGMSDLGLGGWRGQELGVESQGGQKAGVSLLSAHLRPASGGRATGRVVLGLARAQGGALFGTPLIHLLVSCCIWMRLLPRF